MKIMAGLIILTLAACAVLASHQRKPFPLLVTAGARVDMTDEYACMRLLTPYRLTNDPKPISRT